MGKAVIFKNDGGPLAEMIARPVFRGDNYGLKQALVSDSDDVLIEFFDPNHPHEDLGDGLTGQFINRYNLSTLEGGVDLRSGIDLQGGVDSWKLSGAGFVNAMLAISDEVTARVAPDFLDGADNADIIDMLQDLAHESADAADIPSGDERDDFVRSAMEPFFDEAETVTESAVRILRSFEVPADKIRPIMRAALISDSPSP